MARRRCAAKRLQLTVAESLHKLASDVMRFKQSALPTAESKKSKVSSGAYLMPTAADV